MFFENNVDFILFLTTVALFLYFIYPQLKEKQISVPGNFMLASLPYLISLGIVSAEAASGGKALLSTATVSAAILYFSYSTSENIQKSNSREGLVGLVLTSFLLIHVGLPEYVPLIQALSLSILATGLTAFSFVFIWSSGNNFLTLGAISAHFLDASSTVVALQNSLTESRVLASLFIELLGPYGVFLMKALIIVPVVYFSREEFNEMYSGLLLYSVFSLGLVLGVRNLFLI